MATIVSTGILAVVLAICVVAFTTVTVLIILVCKGNPNARAKPEIHYEDIKDYSVPSVINTETNFAYDQVLK